MNNLNIKELKSFALTMGWAVPCLFMLILPWVFSRDIPLWPLIISSFLGFLYLVYPVGIYPVYRSWMAIATVVGWINTRVILAVVFYGIILPIGIVLRILGKLQYQAAHTKECQSFWIDRGKLNKEELERPF